MHVFALKELLEEQKKKVEAMLAAMTPEEAATFEPKIVFPDGANNNSLD